MTRRQPEQELHFAVMDFLKLCLLPPAFPFHIPNGGLRLRSEAGKLKRMGVQAGMPDIAVVYPFGQILFIELKAPKGILSDAQKAVHATIDATGAEIYVCKSLDDVQQALERAGVQTRIARAA
jgi:hypothetical protein